MKSTPSFVEDLFSLSQEELKVAFEQKNLELRNRVFVGDLSNGSFCQLDCKRLTGKESLQFFSSPAIAIRAGFHPCTHCSPIQFPDWMHTFFLEVENQLSEDDDKLLLDPLKINVSRVSNWMKNNLDMTTQGYFKILRINRKFLVSDGHSFEKLTTSSDNTSNNILIERINSPLGTLIAGIYDDDLCLLEFSDRRMLSTQIKRIKKIFEVDVVKRKHVLFEQLQNELNEYFEGIRKTFSIPLQMKGSAFQQRVWGKLLDIEYGQTKRYAEQAEALENPLAIRAIARANGDNRIAILIPCHRVIGSDGSLTGYGGGLWRKKFLLDLEGCHI